MNQKPHTKMNQKISNRHTAIIGAINSLGYDQTVDAFKIVAFKKGTSTPVFTGNIEQAERWVMDYEHKKIQKEIAPCAAGLHSHFTHGSLAYMIAIVHFVTAALMPVNAFSILIGSLGLVYFLCGIRDTLKHFQIITK